jgi:hypothetical protein
MKCESGIETRREVDVQLCALNSRQQNIPLNCVIPSHLAKNLYLLLLELNKINYLILAS